MSMAIKGSMVALNPNRKDDVTEVFNVTRFGATGGGTTDDTAAIRAAIDAAGTNGIIYFPPGNTFLINKSLPMQAGQTFTGYGATIKRGAEIKSAITVDVSSGTSVTVTDGSLFEVNMEVSLTAAAGETSEGYETINRITAINGNVITLAQAVLGSYTAAAGDVLLNVCIPFSGTLSNVLYSDSTPDDVKIIGLEFDGNRSGNTTGLRWELQREVSQLGDRSIVQNCYFHDSAGEGIVGIGHDGKISNCHFEDMNGNGIHYSGGDGVTTNSCTFSNVNILQRGTAEAFTAANATNEITFTSLTPVDGNVITVSSSTRDLPNGLNNVTIYYAINSSGSTCQLSLTVGGAAVTFSDDGTGTLTGRLGTNIGHQGGAIDYSTVCAEMNIVDISVDGALAAIGSVSSEADGSVFTNINARNCDLNYIQCESTLGSLCITGGIADTCTLFRLQGDGVTVKNVSCIDTPVRIDSTNSSVDVVVSMPTNTVDDCIQITTDNNDVNAVCTGGYTGLSFGGGAQKNTVKIKAINNYTNGIEIGGTNDSLVNANIVTPHIILESTYTEFASYRGIDFGATGMIKGGIMDVSIGASGRAIDFRASCDDSFIDGLVILAVGTPADICRINSQDGISCRNMTFPAGTTSANAFNIATATNFVPLNNYAIDDNATPLTGA